MKAQWEEMRSQHEATMHHLESQLEALLKLIAQAAK